MSLPDSLSKDSRIYWDARDEIWRNIYRALHDYRLSNMTFEDSDEPYPLLDNMTRDGESIDDGEMELVCLADEISVAISYNERFNHFRSLFREAIENHTVFGVEPKSMHKIHIHYELLQFMKMMFRID